jgi:uncharacterized protein (UPF0210 family)
MKIRSITYFIDPGRPVRVEAFTQAADFAAQARQSFSQAGYEVQTLRLATVPFPRLLTTWDPDAIVEVLGGISQIAGENGFDYLALGPASPELPDSYLAIPVLIEATQNTFFSGIMTTAEGGISLPAVRACAHIIHQVAGISPDGFANLRFAALANVSAGTPFFPAAYHAGGRPAFAVATQAADLAVQAFSHAADLGQARRNLVAAVESHADALNRIAERLADQFGIAFGGIDFSLAPFPEEAASLGTAMEELGLLQAGLHGSLAAAAFLADILDQAQFRRVGFSGLMLPVLEDAILAKRAAEGALTLKDLLLYSAVCGTGLDTVPLPGDVTVDTLASVLLDLAALAQRLDKPLTARLMPIPGKTAGDPIQFDFAYFANSRVMGVEASPSGGLLAGQDTFALRPRHFHLRDR